MQKIAIRNEKRQSSNDKLPYVLMRIEGLIDAPNFMIFEKAIEKLLTANERRVIIDFRKVQYINSTGISLIIRFHSALVEKAGALVLTQVPRNVGLSMHLLGITSIVPFLKGLSEAEGYLENVPADGPADAEFLEDGSASTSVKEIPVLANEAPENPGTVLMCVPRAGHLTRIMEKRVGQQNGRYHLVHAIDQMHSELDRLKPDLVVLDHRISGVDEFISTLKVDTPHSLTSVIVLYERGTELHRFNGFRVWENDYLVDPFEINNLFALTERELRRVPHDKRVFSQQVNFQFSSDRDEVDQGLKLGNTLIQRLKISDADSTALFAAFKEAIDNATLHGNRYEDGKIVGVNFLVDPNKATFIVEDNGDGFDYEYFLSQIDSREAFERAKQRIRAGGRGGLGILLMHKCTDRLEYSGSGNIVRLEKNLPT